MTQPNRDQPRGPFPTFDFIQLAFVTIGLIGIPVGAGIAWGLGHAIIGGSISAVAAGVFMGFSGRR